MQSFTLVVKEDNTLPYQNYCAAVEEGQPPTIPKICVQLLKKGVEVHVKILSVNYKASYFHSHDC